jgi:hypothetical protein
VSVGICWQRTCNYIGVRIAPKPAASDSATPTLVSGAKSSGTSFLDILMSGTGVGVQLAAPSGEQSQAQSEGDSKDGSKEGEDGAQSATLQADASASAATESSALLQTTDQSNAPQSGRASDFAGSSASVQNNATPNLSVNFGAAQWLANSTNALAPFVNASTTGTAPAAPATTSTKISNATPGGQGKPASTLPASSDKSALASLLVAIPLLIPIPVDQAPVKQALGRSSQSTGNTIDGASQDTASQANAQSTVTAPTNPKPSQTSVPTTIANPMLTFPDLPTQDIQTANAGDPAAPDLTLAANSTVASTFLSAPILPNMGATNSFAAKLSQFKTAGATFAVPSSASSSSPNQTSVTSSAGATKNSAQDSNGSPVRTTPNNSDPAQHTQTDASQAANAAGKPADSAAAQTISFGSVVTSHETAQPHSASGAASDAPRTDAEAAHVAADASNAAAVAGSAGINSARVIQSMNETEMRVGMHSTEFGDISVRTMVSQQQVQAQISVDHSELGSAISAHIPSMQAKLGNDLGLHATIEVSQSGMSFSGERGQSSAKDQRPFVQSIQADGTQASAETDRLPLRAPPTVLDGSRLDIRA